MTTVFKNGHIYTMNREMPYVSALVARDSKIAYVGGDEGAEAFEAGAQVIDLNGKMMIPGMIDTHCHPSLAAFLTSGILCNAEMSWEETLETIRAYVKSHPDQENYFGIGYPEWVFDETTGPLKEELDAICPDKPVYLMSTGGHEAWCNSKTYEVLKITKDTPDPLPGYSYFRRDENGEPMGQIIETVAQNLVMSGLPWFDTEKVKGVYQRTFDLYSALSVTGFVDCGTFAPFERLGMQYLGEFEKEGTLKQRICSCAFAGDPDRMDAVLDLLREYHEAYHSEIFNVNTMKIVNDGTVDSCSCAMLEPYPDGSVVEPMAQGETLYRKCVEAAIFSRSVCTMFERSEPRAMAALPLAAMVCSICGILLPGDLGWFLDMSSFNFTFLLLSLIYGSLLRRSRGTELYAPAAKYRRLMFLVGLFSALSILETIVYLAGAHAVIDRILPVYKSHINFSCDILSLLLSAWLVWFSRKEQDTYISQQLEDILQQRILEFQLQEQERQKQVGAEQIDKFGKYYGLTERETEILRLILEGKSNQEIGQMLYITTGTVKTHVHSIFNKLEVSRRGQLMSKFVNHRP